MTCDAILANETSVDVSRNYTEPSPLLPEQIQSDCSRAWSRVKVRWARHSPWGAQPGARWGLQSLKWRLQPESWRSRSKAYEKLFVPHYERTLPRDVALAKVAGILEPVGLQEEAELPAQILAEFVMDSQKKDKLLCSQLQVVDFLQNFLVQEGTAQDQNPLVSEDTSRQKAIEAKEQWKELKATYQEHVEVIPNSLSQALPKVEEAHTNQAQLQEALKQLQTKVNQWWGEWRASREEEGKGEYASLDLLVIF